MCVFLGSLCLKFLLRDDFKSLKCWLDLWLSCMLDCIHICVFPFLKNDFLSNLDTSSIPPWHLAIYWALKVFSYHNINRSSTTGGSNKKVPGPSIAFRQLVDRLSFSSCVFALFLDTFSTSASVDVVFLETSICQELLRIYIFSLRDLVLISSICLHLFTSQITLSHSKPLSQVFFKLFQFFFTW